MRDSPSENESQDPVRTELGPTEDKSQALVRTVQALERTESGPRENRVRLYKDGTQGQ